MFIEVVCCVEFNFVSLLQLRATACALERRIEVIQPGGRVLSFGQEYSNRNPLVITFHRFAYNLGEHYNSTVPNNITVVPENDFDTGR